jgi:hypothetical protein
MSLVCLFFLCLWCTVVRAMWRLDGELGSVYSCYACPWKMLRSARVVLRKQQDSMRNRKRGLYKCFFPYKWIENCSYSIKMTST